MPYRSLIGAIALAAMVAVADANAFDESKYPDLKGPWQRIGLPQWDQSTSPAPLTSEYRALYEANLKARQSGSPGNDPTLTCLAPGMPRIMNGYAPVEIVVTPDTTHILIEHIHDSRRIYTDGRSWPDELEASFRGHSIGRWEDTDGDGRYDTLVAETRHMKAPRWLDSTGLALHEDGESVVKERIYLDRSDPDILIDEITVIDNALTHPWTVIKKYLRDRAARPIWRESVCADNSNHVAIGKEIYTVSADGYLMPARKDQPPPDLRYFPQARK